MRRGLIATMLLFAAVQSTPVLAQTAASCSVEGRITFDPGITMTPSRGTFEGEASLECAGAMGGRQLAGPGAISFEGTYGSGTVADLQGGNNCLAGSGPATFDGYVETSDGGSIPIAGTFEANAVSPVNVDLGSGADGSPAAGVLTVFPTEGDCLETPVTEGTVEGRTGTLGAT
ncbi:MAG: hypothetical protein ACREQY_08790 [Candidatus Binatia bacterium]